MKKIKEPIVYLLQEPTSEKDLSSAAKYGNIVPIIGSHEKPGWNIQVTLNKLKNKLQDYDPENDSICFPGGDPIVQLIAGIVLERLGFYEVTYLQWNRSRDPNNNPTGSGFYVPKKIQLKPKYKYQDHSNEHE